MIVVEMNKINHVEYLRFYSDKNLYVKVKGTEDLLNEVVVLSDQKVDVVETDIQIEVHEVDNEVPMDIEDRLNEVTSAVNELKAQIASAESFSDFKTAVSDQKARRP